MKIRKGFVSNSSSSSWIFIVDQEDDEKIDKEILEKFIMKTIHKNSYVFDELKSKRKDIMLSKIQNAVHPLLDPNDKKKWKNYSYYTDKGSDKSVFLCCIGMKTADYNRDKSRLYEYEKFFNKIKDEEKKGFYIIVGQDADETGVAIGCDLEKCFLEHVRENNHYAELDGQKLYLMEFRV